MKYTKYPELKRRQKVLARDIKLWKGNRKLKKRIQLNLQEWQIGAKLCRLKNEFRHNHIAYCMLRGRKYEEIERFCREAPDFDFVDEITEKHAQKAICASA